MLQAPKKSFSIDKNTVEECDKKIALLEERSRYAHEALKSLQEKEASGVSIYEENFCQELVYDIIESVCPEPYEELVGWIDALENKVPENSPYIDVLEQCYDDELSASFIQLMEVADSQEEAEISLGSLSQIVEFYDMYFLKRGKELLAFAKSETLCREKK